MNKTTIHILSSLVASAGATLAIADKITAVPALPPSLVNAWPLVVFAATLIDRIGSAIIDTLKEEK
jgi:hypothetical protein